jgi:hypothetical protein
LFVSYNRTFAVRLSFVFVIPRWALTRRVNPRSFRWVLIQHPCVPGYHRRILHISLLRWGSHVFEAKRWRCAAVNAIPAMNGVNGLHSAHTFLRQLSGYVITRDKLLYMPLCACTLYSHSELPFTGFPPPKSTLYSTIGETYIFA